MQKAHYSGHKLPGNKIGFAAAVMRMSELAGQRSAYRPSNTLATSLYFHTPVTRAACKELGLVGGGAQSCTLPQQEGMIA